MKVLADAGPGSGKSTTLASTHKFLLSGMLPSQLPTQEQFSFMYYVRENFPAIHPSQAVFVCMTDAGKKDLIQKVQSSTRCFTYNGLGASALIRMRKRQQLDQKRGEKILQRHMGQNIKDLVYHQRREAWSLLVYINKLKEELLEVTEENLYFIYEKYGMDSPPPENLDLVQGVLESMRNDDGTVEWIDQMWLTLNHIQHPMYKIGYVDECQDLSNLKLLFMMKMCENLIFCGDPYQAINGFAGADYNVFTKVKRLSNSLFGLKTCFRCPPNHIKHVNTIRPARLTAFKTENVPDEHVNVNDLGNYVKQVPENQTQLMVGRLNNILLQVGIKLLSQGVSCYIVARKDSQTGIDVLIRNYIKSSNCKSLTSLKNFAESDIERSFSMKFQAGTTLREKASCIIELMKSDKVHSIESLIELVDLLAQSRKGVALSTIHKAKGLEADYVYILYPPVRLKTDNQDQAEQEINLEFVAESRSRHQKIYVRN